jgi:nitrite reductase (NADH) large subunit
MSRSDSHFAATRVFEDFTRRRRIVPGAIWTAARVAALGVWIAVAFSTIFDEHVGLSLLWGLVVPLVPALLVVTPGLWRQICPLAFVNQLPRRLGFAGRRPLPDRLASAAFPISVAVFVVVVALREPVFNHSGAATGAALLLALAGAAIGGMLFVGRSGWCGTFCPLAPIQRVYGQAPAIDVVQTHCETCVGCQKNCYDFNPIASVFDDMLDDDRFWSDRRRIFVGMLPGLILAYFIELQAPETTLVRHLATMTIVPAATAGLYWVLTAFLRTDPHRTGVAFAGLSLVFFYWFAGPTVVATAYSLFDLPGPDVLVPASRSVGFVSAVLLFVAARRNVARYDAASREAKAASPAVPSGHAVTFEGATFLAGDGQTLLTVLQAGGVTTRANCRSGLCGSDMFVVLEGAEHLSPPTEDERATLARFAAPAGARLACCARVHGPVAVMLPGTAANRVLDPPATDTSPGIPPERLAAALGRNRPARAMLDRAAEVGLRRVVIIGNGIAGVTVADELRRAGPSVEIVVVALDDRPLYNRMALAKVAEGACAVSDLVLQPWSWYDERGIETVLDVRVTSIDRGGRRIVLEDGRTISYDKLVLATGGRARTPDPTFLARENGFAPHTAADAEALAAHVVRAGSRRAVVLGAGVLGVEFSETFARRGLETVLVGRGALPMDRELDREGAGLLLRHLTGMGIDYRANAEVVRVAGASRIDRIELADGRRVEGDVFVACMGMQPNRELALTCGLDVGRGVLINALAMTSDPDIFAVGDVAELPGGRGGLWPVAVAQAKTAVATMLGIGERHLDLRTPVRLKIEAIEVKYFGTSQAEPGDEIFHAPLFSGDWWRIVVRDGRVAGAVTVGPAAHANPIWDLVRDDVVIDPWRAALREGRLDRLRTPGPRGASA